MNRHFLILVLLAVAIGSAPIGAVAQDGNTTIPNGTETTTTVSGETETKNVSVELTESGTLVLSSWRFEDGTFYLTLRAEVPEIITVTDSGYMMEELAEGEGEKSRDVPYERYTLSSGKTVVQFDATVIDGEAAITVGSTDKLRLLRTGSMSAGDKPAVSWQTVQLLLIGAVGMTAGMTFRVVRKKTEDETKEAERLI